MNEKAPPSAFISALTTEHYVLQSALSGNTSEVGTRASLYLFSLSSSLVALGFASRSPELFVPFVAIVLPALFILGLFTAVRLVDSKLEGIVYLNGIARIRQYYRTLTPEASEHFSPQSGRWPENESWPALRMGPTIGLITTTASMVAFLNSHRGRGGCGHAGRRAASGGPDSPRLADRWRRSFGADGALLHLSEVAVRLGARAHVGAGRTVGRAGSA